MIFQKGVTPWNKGKSCPSTRPFKELCIHGHIREKRKDGSGFCRQCKNAQYKKIGRKRKEFCVRGHPRPIELVGKPCPDCKRIRYEKWYAENRDRLRNGWRDFNHPHRAYSWKTHGIRNEDGQFFSINDFNRHFQIQGGRCKGCGKHQSELSRAMAVDHDHSTGLFRALLCDHCNKILGLAEDSKDTLIKLASILSEVNSDE